MLDKASQNPGKHTSLIVLGWSRSTSIIEVKIDPNCNVVTQQLLRVQRSSGPERCHSLNQRYSVHLLV